MKETTADLTEMGRAIAASGGETLADPAVAASPRERGRFRSGVDHWRHLPAFRSFACDSPLPAIAAALLRSRKVNLYEDSVLVKEPGTAEPTAFRQDLGYFHVEGEQICTFWVPLDPVSAENGAVVVRARLPPRRPRLPAQPLRLAAADSRHAGRGGARHRGEPSGTSTWCSFAMEPGDVAVHHARTLHGAPGNRSADGAPPRDLGALLRRRRALPDPRGRAAQAPSAERARRGRPRLGGLSGRVPGLRRGRVPGRAAPRALPPPFGPS